jgi:uncharacterized protein (TIGR02246 family)
MDINDFSTCLSMRGADHPMQRSLLVWEIVVRQKHVGRITCTGLAELCSLAGSSQRLRCLRAFCSPHQRKRRTPALDRFSAAYSANDVDALVALYAPNAILLGTNSPVISEGRDAVRTYFTNLKLAGSGNKNEIQDRRTIVINDTAVVVTGFYDFTRISDGKPVPGPAHFTVLLTKTTGQWLISHQHSSA